MRAIVSTDKLANANSQWVLRGKWNRIFCAKIGGTPVRSLVTFQERYPPSSLQQVWSVAQRGNALRAVVWALLLASHIGRGRVGGSEPPN